MSYFFIVRISPHRMRVIRGVDSGEDTFLLQIASEHFWKIINKCSDNYLPYTGLFGIIILYLLSFVVII